MVGDANDENRFSHKLLLIQKVRSYVNSSANNSSTNTKLSKTLLHIAEHSRGFLGKILGPLLKTGLLLIALKPLAKTV